MAMAISAWLSMQLQGSRNRLRPVRDCFPFPDGLPLREKNRNAGQKQCRQKLRPENIFM